MAWPVRYKLVGLLTTGSTINYADRVNISVAAPVMMSALGWDEAHFGVIFSAFLAGYTLLQFPGGVIADFPAPSSAAPRLSASPARTWVRPCPTPSPPGWC